MRLWLAFFSLPGQGIKTLKAAMFFSPPLSQKRSEVENSDYCSNLWEKSVCLGKSSLHLGQKTPDNNNTIFNNSNNTSNSAKLEIGSKKEREPQVLSSEGFALPLPLHRSNPYRNSRTIREIGFMMTSGGEEPSAWASLVLGEEGRDRRPLPPVTVNKSALVSLKNCLEKMSKLKCKKSTNPPRERSW